MEMMMEMMMMTEGEGEKKGGEGGLARAWNGMGWDGGGCRR